MSSPDKNTTPKFSVQLKSSERPVDDLREHMLTLDADPVRKTLYRALLPDLATSLVQLEKRGRLEKEQTLLSLVRAIENGAVRTTAQLAKLVPPHLLGHSRDLIHFRIELDRQAIDRRQPANATPRPALERR